MRHRAVDNQAYRNSHQAPAHRLVEALHQAHSVKVREGLDMQTNHCSHFAGKSQVTDQNYLLPTTAMDRYQRENYHYQSRAYRVNQVNL